MRRANFNHNAGSHIDPPTIVASAGKFEFMESMLI